MRFGILGPLDVADNGGHKLGLGGHKQRSVLAVLLLHPNEVVSSDRLVEDLWSDHPPASAATSLQVHVSRLRRALGADHRIVTTGGGYLVRVAPGELDAERFQRLVEEGSAAVATEDWELASAKLRDALGLWRGPPLSDFQYDSFAQAEISRLGELHVSALEDRIESGLALGDGGTLVGELEGLVREHPYRERLRGQLMLALYRAGRQTEALASYRELCEVFRDELGLQPGESLRELERAILRQDPSLLAPPAGVPTHAAGRLPVPATPFLGRARELSEVTALVWGAGGRLVTLTGAGGSGKTRLALRAAQACADDYRGGAWFVGFADLTDPDLIAPVICQALGLGEQPDLTPAQRLEEYLRDRELLLVLDNLEQLTPGVGVLGELLAGCAGVRMLATSREPLQLAAEQQYEVPVLDLDDAIELFIARARKIEPSLTIEREIAGAVCERLDRLPLAIELAAARTKVLPAAEILSRLERRLPVLASGPRDAPRRQRTLQATIDWSYGLLAEEEQRLLARLSVFAGGCTFQAAEVVCGAELDALGALVDRSLLRADGERYGMLQTLREYALEKLARSGEEDPVRRGHARWFIELLHAHRLDECLPDVSPQKSRARGLVEEDERENFRAALEWAEQAGEIETVARLAAPLTTLWIRQGRLSEADRWLGVARGRSSEYPLAVQGLVLTAARELACARGAHQESADLCEQALAIYRELGDAAGMLLETTKRAAAAGALGDQRRSRALLEEALAIEREHDLTHTHAHTLVHVAGYYKAVGRLDRERAVLEEALLATEVGSGPRVLVQVNLAHIANVERRHADAAELAQEVLEPAFAIRQSHNAAIAALEFAWSLAELHQPERATRILGAALEFFRATFMAAVQAESEQAIRDALEAQLDERTFQALLDEGRAMTVEQAVRAERQQTKLHA